ncbi:MAG: hypothetical protein HY600_04450 [Candidatus Omnitrophica bacterium]|nr:hypothetical protein [Candidatus Omnitrophota bacterium]
MTHDQMRGTIGITLFLLGMAGGWAAPSVTAQQAVGPGVEAPPASRPTDLRRVAGVVDAADVRAGRLTLRQHRRGTAGPLMEFVITPRDTIVTDAWDQQFLTPDDLAPGAWVQVEYLMLPTGERKATTIVLERAAGAATARPVLRDLLWSTGIIQSVDILKGVLILEEMRPGYPPQRTEVLINWRDTHVALGGYEQFLALDDMRPGDRAEVGYIVDQGQRRARAVVIEPSEPVRP